MNNHQIKNFPSTPPRSNYDYKDFTKTPDTHNSVLSKSHFFCDKHSLNDNNKSIPGFVKNKYNKLHTCSNLLTPVFTPHRSPWQKKIRKDHIANCSPLRPTILFKKKLTIGCGRDFNSRLSLKLYNENLIQADENNNFYHLNTKEFIVSNLNEEPKTPKKNIITDQLIYNWHGRSFSTLSSDDDENDNSNNLFSNSKFIKKKKQHENPFSDFNDQNNVKKKKKKIGFMTNPFLNDNKDDNDSKQTVNYDTHIELISKNGKKIVRELDDFQKKIKPRKLDFSHLICQKTELAHNSE